KMKTYDDCLAHVAAAERSPAFAKASASAKKALATNGGLCRAAKKKRIPGDPAYDFSWLLQAPPRTQVVLDGRFDGLLAAVVPEVHLDGGQPLREALKLA